MRQISNNTLSATVSDSVYNESTATLIIRGLTGAEVATLQISGDNVNFVNYYEGGNLVQLSATSTSHTLAYPGYYRVSVPNTSATASVHVAKPEWANIIDRPVTTIDDPGPWEPSDLSTNLLLWLDAEDQDTIVEISDKISQWSDKSGNARHFTQNSVAVRPVYSSSTYGLCISYAAGDYLIIPTGAIEAISPETFVIVGLCNFGTAGVNNRYIYYNGRINDVSGAGQQIQAYGDIIFMYDAYDSNSYIYSGADPIDVSQDCIFTMYHDGTNLVKRKYGVQFESDVTEGTYSTAVESTNVLGAQSFDGNIYSFIIANYTSDDDMQKLEGYICHRYGAQALLDSGHPYRNEAP